MTDILTPARPTVRPRRPSAATLVGLEIRKSLSTRSGKAVALASAALAPAAVTVLASSGDELDGAAVPIGGVRHGDRVRAVTLGVLATASEWSHRTAETTFLLEPRRGRVLAPRPWPWRAGAVFAAVASALRPGAVGGADRNPSWDGVPLALVASSLPVLRSR